MVVEKLTELNALSEELARRLGREPYTPQRPPGHDLLHPQLVEVLGSGAYVWQEQGIDLARVRELTDKAHQRGLRQVWVFGWHPKGHTWWAAPLYHGERVEILEIDRHGRLAETELTLDGFVDRVAEQTRATIDRLDRPAPERAEAAADLPAAPKKMRIARVELPESAGATVAAGGRTERFSGEELGYLIWSLDGLQMLADDEPPDLSAWDDRTLRRLGLDEPPSEADAAYPEYRATWRRLSRRDRSAPTSDRGRVARHKLSETGSWVLAPNELAMLRRNEQAKAPRHRPSDEQAAIWTRFMDLCREDEVELLVD